jgi:predicted nucleic acid-binding protein
MTVTFADTSYFLALLNPRDSAHSAAVAIRGGLRGRLVTTQYILTEVADDLASARDRRRFLVLLAVLAADPDVMIVPGTDEPFRRGVEPYRKRPDKDWPLADCISFVVMGDHGITDALTGDVHFRQAGLRPLFES